MFRTLRVRVLVARLLAVCGVGLCCAPAVAVADQSITSSGPIEYLTVGDDLACQVSYGQGGTFEFYPPNTAPGDCGTFVSVGGTLYAPSFELHDRTATGLADASALTPVNESFSGTGTSTDPYAIVTRVKAGESGVTLEQRTTYVTGQSSFRVDITARNETGDPKQIRVYWAGDCYASGSDIGYGFVRPEIRSIGCSQAPDNNPAGRTIQLLPLAAGSTGIEDRFYRVWERVAASDAFDGSCLCAQNVDNGVGLTWNTVLPSVTTRTFSLQVAFTEATAPAAPADTDGDALPDSWETGQASGTDAENLAPLGADPNRRDIFVHADWMAGCKPPAGWEKPAIDMFAEKGIALHVDSGGDSINANGQPWGVQSRAGELPYRDVLDLRNWQQVDAGKDAHLLPSGRRRAFHYVLFGSKAFTEDGDTPEAMGLSRGIPDSDFVVANCKSSPRADAEYFVHELGHNLGLRHGGDEDKNYKTSYFSAMNYGWALWALGGEGRFIAYSDNVRPSIDENNIDEHAGIGAPVVYFCPKDGLQPSHPGQRVFGTGVLTDWDFDCDGRWGERRVRANLDGSWQPGRNLLQQEVKAPVFDTLTGFNDWPAIRFNGGGVVGALILPARQDPAPVPELTGTEVQQSAAVEQAVSTQETKTLRINTRARQLRKPKRRKAKTTISVQVTSITGVPVRNASVRVRGGTLARGRKSQRTDRRGKVRLKLLLRSRKQLEISAKRVGYRPATLLVPVVGRTP